MTVEFVAGNLALDFANTVHSHGSSGPQDHLKTYGDLIGWSQQAGLLSDRQRRNRKEEKPLSKKPTSNVRRNCASPFTAFFLAWRGEKGSPLKQRRSSICILERLWPRLASKALVNVSP